MSNMGELLTLSWPTHHQQLVEGLWNLFLERLETDFELRVGDDDNTNNFIKAHYLILAIFCPLIRNINSKRYILSTKIDRDDLKSLVEFIYKGETEIEEIRVQNLKSAAQQLGFQALVNLIETRSMRRKMNRKDEEDKASKPKRKAKKPVKIPRLNNVNSTTSSRRQQRKRKQMSKSTKYFQTSEDEKTEDSDKDFVLNQENEDGGKTSDKNSSAEDTLAPNCVADKLLCTICDKKFKTRQTFRQHMRRHTYPDIVQQCPHCPFKAYNFKSKLFYHVASKHQMDLQGNLLEKTFKCPDCDFACVAEFQLKSHKIYKHSAKIHKCDVCPYASNSRADLRKHQDGVHGNKRPFMCETCGFAAKSSSNLHLHLSIHKEKVVCEICGVTVKCRGLSLHMQTVHGENRKPFHCHLCSLATRCKFNLKVHLTRVHKLSADEVKNVLNKRNSNYAQECASVETPVMTLEQTIDPNLNIPYLPFGHEQLNHCNVDSGVLNTTPTHNQ